MSEKIAVHTFTREEFLNVIEKIPIGSWDSADRDDREVYDVYESNTCIDLSDGGYDHMEGFDGYTIISAEEYLREVEFKVGDRVEIVKEHGDAQIGAKGIVISTNHTMYEQKHIGVKFDERINTSSDVAKEKGYGYYVYPECLKLIKSNKTKKENNNMDISDNILEVFENSKDAKKVAVRFKGQYGDTDRDLLALRRDAKDLLAIIKKEEDEANKD